MGLILSTEIYKSLFQTKKLYLIIVTDYKFKFTDVKKFKFHDNLMLLVGIEITTFFFCKKLSGQFKFHENWMLLIGNESSTASVTMCRYLLIYYIGTCLYI